MSKKAHKVEIKKISKPKTKKKIQPKDLLPESREFLEKEESVFSPAENHRVVGFRDEFHKKMIMWSGISFFMVLVFVVWIFNTKKIFQETAMTAPQGEKQELGEIFQELNSVMQEAKEGLDSLGNIEQDKAGNKLPVNEETNKINKLKARLEEGQDQGVKL